MADLKVSFPQPCDEKWEAMAEQGCNRHCATCDATIYDLSSMTAGEAGVLLNSGEDICVRAHVRTDGSIRTSEPQGQNSRKIVAALGATASLALAACQPTAQVSRVTPRFEIAGQLNPGMWSSRAELRSATGKRYHSWIRGDRKFRFTNLPAGQYSLSFADSCGDAHEFKDIVVSDDMDMGELKWVDEEACIIIGKMKLVDEPRQG